MADTQRISQIPVMTPRATHSSIPSAVSSPHLGLVSPSRYPSVSGSPTSTPSSPSGGGSTPFRTFRNFLSFGVGNSNKNAPPAPSPSAAPKSHFSTLGPIRRSVNVERRASSPQLHRRSEDDYVLSIGSRPGDSKSPHTRLAKSSDPTRTPLSHNTYSDSPIADSSVSTFDTPALAATELSTIIESDTSGILRHLPSLDTSQASDRGSLPHPSPNVSSQSLHPPHRDTRRGSSSPSHDTSLLDLDISSSQLTTEVLAALSQTGSKQDWSHAMVVDEASDSGISRGRTPESPDTSFNLNALDPDLAALLSPHRSKGSTEPALLAAINLNPSSTPPPPSPTKLPSPTRSSPGYMVEMQATTSMRRIPPTSLSAAPRLPSSSSGLPRITRSVSDRPALTTSGGPPSPVTRTPARPMSTSPERPIPTAASRLARGTSVDATAEFSMRRPGSSGMADGRRTPASRLMTPSRPGSSSASTRPPPSRLHSAHPQPRAWDAESASPYSRPPSSVGTAPSRLQHRGPSLDMERPRLAGGLRTRKRSTSVIENRVTPSTPLPQPRPMAEWLGPRTAKAFAAAGLLDFDRDSVGSPSRPSSRFGTSRSSIDRDRSRYTPSRMAFSEAGSSSSWGGRNGSISRAAGYSEVDALSTPRTVFSSASTAPTSISASSAMQSEVQQLQEKHALETSALLNALADSQRTTRVLREENDQLRDRIQMLEDKLADAQERIQQILSFQPSPLQPKAAYASRYGSPASSSRSLTHSRRNSNARPQSSVYADRMSSSEHPSPSPETPYDGAETFVPPNRKRMSGTSSLFASLPSNMSMIMHEDSGMPEGFGTVSLNSSSPSGSPTMVFARLNGGQASAVPVPKGPSPRGLSHRANMSVSTTGNISPTTASFSIMTSSPGSLNLRPEHERHLGDMPPLDLDFEGEEFEFDDRALR